MELNNIFSQEVTWTKREEINELNTWGSRVSRTDAWHHEIAKFNEKHISRQEYGYIYFNSRLR